MVHHLTTAALAFAFSRAIAIHWTRSIWHPGHGGKKDETDKDAERYFRIVDHAVHTHFSKVSHLPLILLALPEHHHMFHKLSHNPFRLDKGLAVNPEGHSHEELLQRIWELMEPEYIANQLRMVETFAQAHGQGLGSDVCRADARKFRRRGNIQVLNHSKPASQASEEHPVNLTGLGKLIGFDPRLCPGKVVHLRGETAHQRYCHPPAIPPCQRLPSD